MGKNMEIDFYNAGKNCLLILTGRGGNTRGYANKYVKIAEEVTKRYNFSVAVAGVPSTCWDNPQKIFSDIVNAVFTRLAPEKIYVMGSSAGATIALWYAYMCPSIQKVLSVNPVLNLNYHRAKEGIEKFCGGRIFVETGEFDPCAVWVNLLPQKDNLQVEILGGVDHVFKDKLDVFTALPHKTLFADEKHSGE